MNSTIRRIAVTGTTALALGAGALGTVGAASATTVPGNAGTAIHRCATWQLRITVRAIDYSMHHGYDYVDFANTGRSTCFLGGFPGVSAANAGGRTVGNPATREGRWSGRGVNIAPGTAMHARLDYVDPSMEGPGCKPTIAKYLKVFPPASGTYRLVSSGIQVCAARGYHTLGIGTVAPGA